jgi:hypothetical protein
MANNVFGGAPKRVPHRFLSPPGNTGGIDAARVCQSRAGVVVMSNVLPLRRRAQMPLYALELNTDDWAPEYPKGSIFTIDPNREPKDGDIVHVELRFPGGPPFERILPFTERQGRDVRGRFCRAGDPNELVCVIAPLAYRREEINKVVRVLGVASGITVAF